MPGTTRYSATFDRTYEEEDRVDPPPLANARRSRSQSWQANSGLDGRPYTPLGGRPPAQRSSSTDNGPAKGPEHIPTRTSRTTVKAHNNPFQFVKVGTCPLYKKAEEQLKKAKEVKKPEVLKEEEEEWQTNLDSWKSRRRKMSEDVFRRQEEIKQLELEEQISQATQKKTKTFSEMVESRATRGRALSLCLLSSPLEFQNWEYENKSHKNGSCSYTDESGDNSTVNSEDEGVSIRGRLGKNSQSDSEIDHRTNGNAHIEQNGSKLDKQNGDYNKLSDNIQIKPKENSYVDSGLESISSSHRAGDTPDSGSDFSQDSNSSIDCDSPRTGVNVLEEFSSKTSQLSQGSEISFKLNLKEKGQDFGFTFLGGKDEGQVLIASILEGSKAESSGIHLGDRIITIDGADVSSKKHIEIAAMLQKGREKGQISLLLWRHAKSTESTNGFNTDEKLIKPNKSEDSKAKSHEKSIESENEMYVDDFEELRRQSELLTSNKKSQTCTSAQAQTNGNKSPTSVKDAMPLKTSSENSAAPKLKENFSNGAVEEAHKNEQKANSEINNEIQKKNVVKVKRVRRKGVYALNVDSNQIPQEGISVNSLFPLSPVTELPSPADETKTMSSSLSSNNNLAALTSQKEIFNKEKPKEAETKQSSPVVKENSKTVIPIVKVASSKIATPPIELKSVEKESTTLKKTENKTEQTIVPLSPTDVKNKEMGILPEGSQNEKAKPPSAPKKVKVKVKKETSLENASTTSPSVKETPTSIPFMPASVVAETVKKSPTELKPCPQISGKSVKITSGVENAVTSQIRENGTIPSGTSSITPTIEAVTTKNKTPDICKNAGSQSPKTDVNVETANSSLLPNSKLSKTTNVSEGDKPKPIAQKKVKVKPKATTTEQKPSDLPQIPTTSVTNISSAKNAVKESLSKIEQKSTPPSQDRQAKIIVKNENVEASVVKENNDTSVKIAATVQDVKATTMQDNIVNKTAVNDKNNLSLKIDAKSNLTNMPLPSSVTNAKPLKTQVEKSKLAYSQKKDNVKLKENTEEQIPCGTLQMDKDMCTTSDSFTKNAAKESLLKTEQKQSPVVNQDKQSKMANKTEIGVSSTMGNSIPSAEGTTVSTNTKSATSTKEKMPNSSASGDKTKGLSLAIDTVNDSATSPISNVKTPKTPQGEKSKPVFSQKKENAKLKVNTTEPSSSDSSQLPKDTSISSASNTSESSIKNTVKEIPSKKDQKPTPTQDKLSKVETKNETAVSPLARENVSSAGFTAVTPGTTSTKGKISKSSASTDKSRNLSLKIDVQSESVNSSSPPVMNAKPPKTPQGEKSKPVFSQKKENTKLKVNSTSSKHGCNVI